MKVCSIDAKEANSDGSKESQENQKQALGIEVVPIKIGDRGVEEERKTNISLKYKSKG